MAKARIRVFDKWVSHLKFVVGSVFDSLSMFSVDGSF